MIAVIFEKGALLDVEKAREEVESGSGLIEVSKGFRFDIQKREFNSLAVFESGAVDSVETLKGELRKSIAMIEINKGFRFELVDSRF
jgi:hypothetical protein